MYSAMYTVNDHAFFKNLFKIGQPTLNLTSDCNICHGLEFQHRPVPQKESVAQLCRKLRWNYWQIISLIESKKMASVNLILTFAFNLLSLKNYCTVLYCLEWTKLF